MSEQHPRTQQVRRDEPTPWYGWPFVAFGHLFWIWCLLILIEWFAPLWGETTGLNAQRLFLQQLDNLHQEMPGSVDRLLAILADWMEHVAPILSIEFTGLFAFLTPYWHGVVYVTLSLFARIGILLFCYPLFLLVFFLGAFDGLVVRQRRVAFMARDRNPTLLQSQRASFVCDRAELRLVIAARHLVCFIVWIAVTWGHIDRTFGTYRCCDVQEIFVGH